MLKAVASCFSDWCHCNECKRGRSTSAESVSASAHYSPALQQLHWLPVKHCVTFKTATLMHQILQKRCPSYLADLVTSNTTYSQRRHLRSSTIPDPPPYDAHELSSESVHFLFAVLMCGIVSLLRFVISTVIQLSDVPLSHIYLALLFPHNCYPIYSLTL